jgi:hypothetical protein
MDKNKKIIYNKRYYEKSKIKKLQEKQELQENHQEQEKQELLKQHQELLIILRTHQEQLNAHNTVITNLIDIIKQLISN